MDFQSEVRDWRASKHKRESITNRTPEENAGKTQYTACVRHGLKSLHTVLLPCEENGKCSIERYCAEFPSIGNHSL
jgi:hypothetical protein